ncbi:MAG: class I SAM-dependent methyltransferase [Anaerolineae bacterium]|nr:class I SAM-dependent methyltransferase [Anaerolineae bacterium]
MAFHHMRNRAVADYKGCILNCLEPSQHSVSLLDCGCDDGEWTLELGRRIGNARLFGIEIVEERRRLALEKGLDARLGDLNSRFPFSDESMDAVHANQVIEHLADTDKFVGEVWRVLKPNGYAVVCTENLASWHNIFALLLGWQPFSLSNVSETRFQIGNPLAIHSEEPSVNPQSWQHLRVFAYLGLKDIFAEQGFEVVRCVGSGYYPLPNLFSKLDPRHAAFLTIKVRKHL